METTLYPWQKECMSAWFANNGMGTVQVVTGAGKTLLSISIAMQLNTNLLDTLRIKIIVPKTFMVSQWMAELERNGIPRQSIGSWYGDHKDTPSKKYMVYVINSARYSLSRHILHDWQEGVPVLLIADECHHYASSENRKIFEFLRYNSTKLPQRYYALGLSATPQTYNFSRILAPALGDIIYSYGFYEAIKSNVVNNCVLYSIALEFSTDERDSYEALSRKIAKLLKKGISAHWIDNMSSESEFFAQISSLTHHKDKSISLWAYNILSIIRNRSQVVYTAPSRIDCAYSLIHRLGQNAKIIIFCERIPQCDQLYVRLKADFSHRVVRYHSAMGKIAKARAIACYRNGEARILVCCKALDEGFDIPSADVGIILSSTQVERQRIQRLGRILRKKKDIGLSSLYYLYINNTMEDPILLQQDIDQLQQINVSYSKEENSFTNELFDQLVQQILEDVVKKQTDRAHIELMRTIFDEGRLRPDWLLDETIQQQRLHKATTRSEQNYWYCMIRLGRELRNYHMKTTF